MSVVFGSYITEVWSNKCMTIGGDFPMPKANISVNTYVSL